MHKDINLNCNNRLVNNEYVAWLKSLKVGDMIIYEVDTIRQRKKEYIKATIEGVSKKSIYVNEIKILKSVGAVKLDWYILSLSRIITLLPYNTIEECYEKRPQNKSNYGYWL